MIRDITARVEAEEAVKAERQRLSRDLHDSVSQALYSIALGARTARAMVGGDPAGLAAGKTSEFIAVHWLFPCFAGALRKCRSVGSSCDV